MNVSAKIATFHWDSQYFFLRCMIKEFAIEKTNVKKDAEVVGTEHCKQACGIFLAC